MLLHLVEERTCAGMPILVTTQYSGEGMDAQFERKEMGQAIRRRLNESCKVVVVRWSDRAMGSGTRWLRIVTRRRRDKRTQSIFFYLVS